MNTATRYTKAKHLDQKFRMGSFRMCSSMEYDIANIFAIIANITYREYIRDIANIFAISNRDIVNVWSWGVLVRLNGALPGVMGDITSSKLQSGKF